MSLAFLSIVGPMQRVPSTPGFGTVIRFRAKRSTREYFTITLRSTPISHGEAFIGNRCWYNL
jgi:hypothetical protein